VLPPASYEPGHGVMMVPPPPQFLHAIRESVEEYANAIPLTANEHGGFIGIATTTGVNFAVIHKIGGRGMVVGYVAKQWGEPIAGGVQWELRW
jgi:hypothetical protein